MLVGRYEIEVHDRGINLPKNFDLTGKELKISIVDEDGKYLVLSEVGADCEWYFTELNVLNTYTTKYKNNFLPLPEEFLKLDVDNKNKVIVFGMYTVVEIYYNEPDVDKAEIDAYLKIHDLI